MSQPDPAYDLRDSDSLQALFGPVDERSLIKERDHIDANYRALIQASPFFALATAGPEGLDCSPRGDPRGFVEVLDERTLVVPDRRGNNRIDSLRNLLVDPRVALLFLIPGMGETLRVNGRARLNADPALLERHTRDGKVPKLALVIAVDTVFFQCSRAVVRADLWNPAKHVARGEVPSAGRILADASRRPFDGEEYDRALPERVRGSLY
ncbi:pyridoxamine 5'-phosphate oxidase family protein [Corallococcus llansteffanensis]|uniref:Pyridoxamine 5'-phosphate oxidase family protein n=1 Tax=Corallococcus llansteffanensis TaxID=2316731 RepID=A0A3A8PV00_9BACT|nr:pyridoxamine 5'-phosphate oxidase family protein [Corallococcus llansteffanensis]RKH59798.1 pyridoxamine 5'-phosphate oxidase family protein [Corallococcus llansteffanensis]